MIGVNDLHQRTAGELLGLLNRYFSACDQSRRIFVNHPGIKFDQLPTMFKEFQNEKTKQNEKEFNELIGGIEAEIVDLKGMDLLGEDGLHFTAKGHLEVAQLVY
jgi:lysophospholipase L1-like esterase